MRMPVVSPEVVRPCCARPFQRAHHASGTPSDADVVRSHRDRSELTVHDMCTNPRGFSTMMPRSRSGEGGGRSALGTAKPLTTTTTTQRRKPQWGTPGGGSGPAHGH